MRREQQQATQQQAKVARSAELADQRVELPQRQQEESPADQPPGGVEVYVKTAYARDDGLIER